MSSISSGIGVASGLDISSLIQQLLAADANRRVPLQRRLAEVSETRAALQHVQSLLLTLRTSASSLAQPSTLFATSVSSSLTSVLTATSLSGTAAPVHGATTLLVRSLASASRFTSAALASTSTPLGATSATIRFGSGRLVDDRALFLLRGGEGIPRGRIRITDRSGAQATIDLRHALSIDDVLRAINDHTGIDVEARLRADGRGIELVDTSFGSGVLRVQEWGSGTTAAALGLLGSDLDGDGVITGGTLAELGAATPLWSLRGGIPIIDGAASFSIVVDGRAIDVDLGAGPAGIPPRAATLGDVIERIDAALAAAGLSGDIAVTIAPSGDRLRVSYSGSGTLSFVDPPRAPAEGAGDDDSRSTSTSVLHALGLPTQPLAGSGDAGAPAEIDGARLVLGMNDVGFDRLDGGLGLPLAGSLTIADRAGRSLTINDFTGVDSVQMLLERIRTAAAVSGMSLDVGLDASGSRLRISDMNPGLGDLAVSGRVAESLGLSVVPGTHGAGQVIQSRDLRRADIGWGTPLSQLASPPPSGSFRITTASGASAVIEISPEMTVLDLSRAVDATGIPASLRINGLGDALEIVDHSGGTGALVVSDEAGSAASALRLAGSSTTGRIDGTRTVTIELTGTESAAQLAQLLGAVDGVDAQLGDDGAGGTYLMATSTRSGARHGLVLAVDGVDLGLAEVTAARDARILLSPESPLGTLVTSETNVLTNVIPGLSLELRAVSDDVVTVTVSPSLQPLKNAVAAFAAALSGAMANLRTATAVDVDAGIRGPLFGNSVATRTREALRSLVGRTFGSDGRRLASIGITLGANGTVIFDETRLAAALDEDPDAVRDLLAAENGVAARFEQLLGALVEPSSGAFAGDDERLARVAENATQRIERINEAIERRRAVLLARFSAMEAVIERLQWQQATLQSLLASIGSN